MTVWAIVVAAGSGTRFGGPKQLEMLAGRRVLEWSLDVAVNRADGVVLVCSADELESERARAAAAGPNVLVVAGGATRSASVRAGLRSVPTRAEVVVVHDAARPLASVELFDRVVFAVGDGADAAVPGVEVIDTVRRRDGGVIDRDELVAVQTPQAFRASALRAAHSAGGEATDDASLVEAAGGRVVVVAGEVANRKITTPIDLVIAEALVQQRSSRSGGGQR